MPTYDYVCENGHRFEFFQSMKDEPLSKCQECDAKVRRVIGPGAGFIFKGGGFYITENRSKEYKDKAKSDVSGGGSTDAGGTKAADKPADKVAEKPAAKSTDKGGDKGGGSKPSGGGSA